MGVGTEAMLENFDNLFEPMTQSLESVLNVFAEGCSDDPRRRLSEVVVPSGWLDTTRRSNRGRKASGDDKAPCDSLFQKHDGADGNKVKCPAGTVRDSARKCAGTTCVDGDKEKCCRAQCDSLFMKP